MSLIPHILLLILIMALSWRGGLGTCVLDSDFGFTLNCQFKKSSIFRVRNLGGVKGYVGLGFSVGDELGFRQSLSNVEGNKRRSAAGRSSGLSAFAVPEVADNIVSKKSDSARLYQGLNSRILKSTQLSTIPPFKPIPPKDSSTPLKPVTAYVVGPMVAVEMNDSRPVRNLNTGGLQIIQSPNVVPQFQGLPASISRLHTPTMKAPQAFKNALQQATSNFQIQSSLLSNKLSHRAPQNPTAGPQVINVVQLQPQIDRVSSNNVATSAKILPTAIPVSNSIPTDKQKPLDTLNSGLMADTVKQLSQATNLSMETIAAAINLKQQQLLQKQKAATTTTTTTTTERISTDPIKKYPLAGPNRVMNAPKEYYPVGYDKNFDDNFVSRVELPDTSFYCGEQKHFPGLYADEDLGCMVFHVCAFTDDGLIMKSFLCPESTLFDQSILKCNWWFYVDCKSSKKLYDSNIPISKSYQLMKALTFFSSYNKQR